MHLEGPMARRYRRKLVQRRRWELTLLALAIAHWAYHKNREWNALVTELASGRPDPDVHHLDPDLDLEAAPPTAVPTYRIDLTSPSEPGTGSPEQGLIRRGEAHPRRVTVER